MSNTTVAKTVDVLREWFATHSIPEQLVMDNGPQFVADDFEVFAKRNGIKHVKSAPYHPACQTFSSKASRHHMMMVVHCLSACHRTCFRFAPQYMLLLVSLHANYYCNMISGQGSLYCSPTLRKLYRISKPRRSLHMLELMSGLWEKKFWFEISVLALIGFLASLLRCWGLSPTLLRQMRVRDGNVTLIRSSAGLPLLLRLSTCSREC